MLSVDSSCTSPSGVVAVLTGNTADVTDPCKVELIFSSDNPVETAVPITDCIDSGLFLSIFGHAWLSSSIQLNADLYNNTP